MDFVKSELEDVMFQNSRLLSVDLSTSNAWAADFSGCNLAFCDLSEGTFIHADLSHSNLHNCDLKEAIMGDVILDQAEIRYSDLSEAEVDSASMFGTFITDSRAEDVRLYDAVADGCRIIRSEFVQSDFQRAILESTLFQETNLSATDFRGTDLQSTTFNTTQLSDIQVDRATECGIQSGLESRAESAHDWDTIARVYHQLKSEFGNNGLVDRARLFHVRERRARENEAKAAEGMVSVSYLGSLLSRYLTGYGVRVKRIGLVMVLLFSVCTLWYEYSGIPNSVYYSIMTFTTAAPPTSPPSGTFTQLLTMVETFFGTLLIVLLGYVLGNREQF